MTITLSTGLAAIALAVLALNDEAGSDERRVFGLLSLCFAVGSVVAGLVVGFMG